MLQRNCVNRPAIFLVLVDRRSYGDETPMNQKSQDLRSSEMEIEMCLKFCCTSSGRPPTRFQISQASISASLPPMVPTEHFRWTEDHPPVQPRHPLPHTASSLCLFPRICFVPAIIRKFAFLDCERKESRLGRLLPVYYRGFGKRLYCLPCPRYYYRASDSKISARSA